MPNDLTWNQINTEIQLEINKTTVIQKSGTDIVINISQLTGDTYTDLNAIGVTEFVQKFLDYCNKAQAKANQGVEVGQRLAAFPTPTYGNPTKDTDGILRSTCTQTVSSRLAVDKNTITGTQN